MQSASKTHSLFETPLDSLLNQLSEHPLFESHTTANRRGYVASWMVLDEHLYLVRLSGERETEASQFLSLVQEETLRRLLNAERMPVLADWYSGTLQIPQGEELEYVHGGFLSKYERDLFIQVEQGHVVRQWEVDNRPAHIAEQANREQQHKTLLKLSPELPPDARQMAIDCLQAPYEAARKPVPSELAQNPSTHYKLMAYNLMRYSIYMLVRLNFEQEIMEGTILSEADRKARVEFGQADYAVDRAARAVRNLRSLMAPSADMITALQESSFTESLGAARVYIDDLTTALEVTEGLPLPDTDEGCLIWAVQALRQAEHLVLHREYNRLGVAVALIEDAIEASQTAR
jgi:hypothetical protein